MKRIGTIVLGALALLAALPCGTAFADIGMVPSKVELFIAPGERYTAEVVVVNSGAEPVHIDVAPWDFARDGTGKAHPISTADAGTFHACGSWLEIDFGDDPILEPGENRKVAITVNAPADAGFGTYCTYVQVLGTPAEIVPGTTPTVMQMNALLLAVVYPPGGEGKALDKIDELVLAAVLDQVDTPQAGLKRPVLVRASMTNKGNVHLNLDGYVDILAGDEVKAHLPIAEVTLLPDSTLAIERAWDDPPLFGKFTARFYGNAGLESPFVGEHTFWVISAPFVASAAAVLVLLANLGIFVARTFKVERRPMTGRALG